MPDHTHAEYAIDKDLNGLGSRLNNAQVALGEGGVKIERNEKDIAEVAKLVASNAATAQQFALDTITRFGKMETSIVNSVGIIEKKVSNLKWYIMGGVAATGVALRVVAMVWPGG